MHFRKLFLAPAAMFIAFHAANSWAAPGDASIAGDAAKQMITFLRGDFRQMVDLGMLGSGTVFGALRGSWTPVIGGALGVAIYEILINVVK
jgi:hypothetical protein